MRRTSWLLAGGGLANALLARRLQRLSHDPSYDYVILEKGPALFKGQTWSCQLSDVPAEDRDFLLSMVSARWEEYEVRFPSYTRIFQSPYVTIRSEDLRARLNRELPPENILVDTAYPAAHVVGKHVVLAEGFGAPPACGWQKFTGLDLAFERPHGLKRPVLMDATVAQRDGYRFFYLLPFDERRLLVEETFYSNSPDLKPHGIEEYVFNNFAANPWRIERVESGALPIPWEESDRRGRFGVAGGFFHPSTGYSLPSAIRSSRRLIEEIQRGLSVEAALKIIAREEQSENNFYLMLNRMMFLAAPPDERWRIFERFYKLGSGMIERFYAARPTTLDKFRMLSGRPPVKVGRALRALAASEPVWR